MPYTPRIFDIYWPSPPIVTLLWSKDLCIVVTKSLNPNPIKAWRHFWTNLQSWLIKHERIRQGKLLKYPEVNPGTARFSLFEVFVIFVEIFLSTVLFYNVLLSFFPVLEQKKSIFLLIIEFTRNEQVVGTMRFAKQTARRERETTICSSEFCVLRNVRKKVEIVRLQKP